jgi:hypothetical protein
MGDNLKVLLGALGGAFIALILVSIFSRPGERGMMVLAPCADY